MFKDWFEFVFAAGLLLLLVLWLAGHAFLPQWRIDLFRPRKFPLVPHVTNELAPDNEFRYDIPLTYNTIQTGVK